MNDYSFCKFQITKDSGKVIWEITNECNYSCEYCIFSSTGKKPRGELSLEKVIETLISLKKLGFHYIKFTGGEPFIRKDFIDILEYAKNLGFDMDVSTNASFITDEIAQRLVKLNLKFIHISIDGFDQYSHEAVRGKLSFNKTLSGLNVLSKYTNKIRLGCVIHSENEHHLQKIVDFSNQFNINEIIFSMMSPVGRMTNHQQHVAQQSPSELINVIKNLISKNIKINHNLFSEIKTISFDFNKQQYCPGGTQFLFIDSIGTVSPCTWISDQIFEFHHLSLHHYSLNQILNHSTFLKFNKLKLNFNQQCVAKEYLSTPLFNQIYSFATENLQFIYELPYSKKDNALTITGAGDQALELIYQDFKSITCVDINPLTKYWAELKFAAISYFSFYDFINFLSNNPLSLSYQKYKSIKHKLSPETEKFWNHQYLIYDYQGNLIRNSSIFNLKHDEFSLKQINVPYLNNENIYLNIQNKIKNTNIEFIIDNYSIMNFKATFDCILLSNIADYSHKIFTNDYIKEFKTQFVLKSLKNLHLSGILMFAYIYDFENLNNSDIRNKINLQSIRKMYFNEFNYIELTLKSAIKELNNDTVCYLKKDLYENK